MAYNHVRLFFLKYENQLAGAQIILLLRFLFLARACPRSPISFKKLVESGKHKKVALTACMRIAKGISLIRATQEQLPEMMTILNAMIRDGKAWHVA